VIAIAIRLRQEYVRYVVYVDTTTHSTRPTTEVIEITIRLRYDYDISRALLPFDAIRREQKFNMSIFRRSLVVVVSQSNRTQIVISITSVVVECVVASSCRSRSRIAIVM